MGTRRWGGSGSRDQRWLNTPRKRIISQIAEVALARPTHLFQRYRGGQQTRLLGRGGLGRRIDSSLPVAEHTGLRWITVS